MSYRLPPYDVPLDDGDEGSELLVWIAVVVIVLALAYGIVACSDSAPRDLELHGATTTVLVVPQTIAPAVTTEVGP